LARRIWVKLKISRHFLNVLPGLLESMISPAMRLAMISLIGEVSSTSFRLPGKPMRGQKY
jgi:hypothetical protein